MQAAAQLVSPPALQVWCLHIPDVTVCPAMSVSEIFHRSQIELIQAEMMSLS
jgi:hypothetical protein